LSPVVEKEKEEEKKKERELDSINRPFLESQFDFVAKSIVVRGETMFICSENMVHVTNLKVDMQIFIFIIYVFVSFICSDKIIHVYLSYILFAQWYMQILLYIIKYFNCLLGFNSTVSPLHATGRAALSSSPLTHWILICYDWFD
jgi:hypothetical protein